MLIEHYNESLAAVAVLFLMLPCSAASTLETNSASAPAPADSLPNIPPVAGLQAAAAPLLPQSVPLPCVQSLLDFAHHSACREAAQAIEEGNIAGGLAMLDKLACGAFHWRGAVTNGYQQGFFVNALRGYCLERIGDIVKAYRTYQNSRAYFDDTAVAMQCPEPRLEVFLGLGRTCLVAGRYTDAFNWLDLVRLEASATPRIATAADRALIRRAVEIGDYHDAITNFWDLQHLLLETGNLKLEQSGSDLRAANAAVVEDSRHGSPSHTNTNPTSNIQHRAPNVEATEDYKFVRRERILSREEYQEFAQLYFWTHQDRPGFKTVLDGLTLLGIDNDLGVNDPMVNCFLSNIMRADDAEIERFYDLLGYAIMQARALKGDEEYIVMLVNGRNAMARGFTFLSRKNDLKTVRKRIHAVKKQLEKELLAFLNRHTIARSAQWSSQLVRPQPINQDKDSACIQNQYEDALMCADIVCVSGSSARAAALYSNIHAFACCTNIGHCTYDGTTITLASRLGWLRTAGIVTTNAELIWSDDYEPASLREWSYCLWSEGMRANSATVAVLHTWILRNRALPQAYPPLVWYLVRAAAAHKRCRDAQGFIQCISERWQRNSAMNADFYQLWFAACAAQGQCTQAFTALYDGLQHTAIALERVALMEHCVQAFPWARAEDLQTFDRTAYATLLEPLLNNPAMGFAGYRQTYIPARAVGAAEMQMRICIAANDMAGALNIFSNMPPERVHPGTLFRLAECFARVGQTNAAFACMWRAYGMRSLLAGALGGDAIHYPVLETPNLEQWYPAAIREEAAQYLEWFARRMQQCGQLQQTECLDAMKTSPLYHLAERYVANTNFVGRVQ